jgi:hypothetical protein
MVAITRKMKRFQSNVDKEIREFYTRTWTKWLCAKCNHRINSTMYRHRSGNGYVCKTCKFKYEGFKCDSGNCKNVLIKMERSSWRRISTLKGRVTFCNSCYDNVMGYEPRDSSVCSSCLEEATSDSFYTCDEPNFWYKNKTQGAWKCSNRICITCYREHISNADYPSFDEYIKRTFKHCNICIFNSK